MQITRRHGIVLGGAAFAAAALSGTGRAQTATTGDSYETDAGALVIHPVQHASFVMEAPGLVIDVDPVGGAALYGACPGRA